MDRLFTSRHHAALTVSYDGTFRLSLSMELSQGVDVNYAMPCMLPGHVSQGPFHSYGVRRHLVNRARNDVLHKNKLKEKLFSICLATCTTHPRTSGTWPLQTTPHPQARRAGIVPVVARGVVTSLIELCINDILENQERLFPDQFKLCASVRTESFGLEEIHNHRSWLWASATSKPVRNIMFV